MFSHQLQSSELERNKDKYTSMSHSPSLMIRAIVYLGVTCASFHSSLLVFYFIRVIFFPSCRVLLVIFLCVSRLALCLIFQHHEPWVVPLGNIRTNVPVEGSR